MVIYNPSSHFNLVYFFPPKIVFVSVNLTAPFHTDEISHEDPQKSLKNRKIALSPKIHNFQP